MSSPGVCTASGCDRELPAGRVRYCSDACAWRAAKQRQRARRDQDAAERAAVAWSQLRRFQGPLRPAVTPGPTAVAVEAFAAVRGLMVATSVAIVIMPCARVDRPMDDPEAEAAIRDDAERVRRWARKRDMRLRIVA